MIIILTTTVFTQNKCYLFQTNYEERLKSYDNSIKQWLNSNLKIIVVENSGYPFYEFKSETNNRFEIICFNEKELPEAEYLVNNNSKGASELFSINYAIQNSKIIKPDDFIIKITGRYFVPNFEQYISTIDLNDYEALIQNDKTSCEIIGCNYNQKNYIFNKITEHNHVEFMYSERCKNLDKVIILKKLDINGTQMGGVPVIRTSL
jgi:hypothetical protein